ncbi:MAG: nucleotidyltransferase domain-containing protein [Candidatus Aenigmarchaeota archaeon]|nr:nucleotidyltransferase domain-containing protein [Candidatus Aenigmarchaeota archaeon]
MIEKLEKELENVKLVKKDEIEERKNFLIEKSVKLMNEVRKKFGEIVKSVLIFGSVARGDLKPTSDADVWIILDDTLSKTSVDLERVKEEIVSMAESLKDLHVQTTYLTEFWQWVRAGSPELVNFLRYGLVLYDTGFVKPVQRMLQLGLLPPSEEVIKLKQKTSEIRLERIKGDLKNLVFDLRYCASDMIQAVVMYYYKTQPDPKDIPKYLEKMIEEGKIEKEILEKWKEIDKLWKDVDHQIVKEVDGEYVQKTLKLTQEIVERMKKLLPQEILEV